MCIALGRASEKMSASAAYPEERVVASCTAAVDADIHGRDIGDFVGVSLERAPSVKASQKGIRVHYM